jgi:chromate transporter
VLELIVRFFVIGALAFGGGQAALPLLERLTVSDTGWLTPTGFATGIGLAYLTPGPVLILSAYVGFIVYGLPGALAATVAVFAVPVALGAAAARVVHRLSTSARFRAFGRGAAAAAIGLLGITTFSLARPMPPSWLLGVLAVLVLPRRVPAIVVLAVAGVAGYALALTPA